MLAYLSHKGRRVFGSNALAAHDGRGLHSNPRGPLGDRRVGLDLSQSQVKLSSGTRANLGVQAVGCDCRGGHREATELGLLLICPGPTHYSSHHLESNARNIESRTPEVGTVEVGLEGT